MDVTEAIRSRRSVYFFEDKPVPRAAITRGIEAARWAPNHRLTQTWTFHILSDRAKSDIGTLNAKIKVANLPTTTLQSRRDEVESNARKKIENVPELICVTTTRSPEDSFVEKENYAASCCAIHNLTLSLWSEGIGLQWSTGAVTRDLQTYKRLAIDPMGYEIIGFLKVGYPKRVGTSERQSIDYFTQYVD